MHAVSCFTASVSLRLDLGPRDDTVTGQQTRIGVENMATGITATMMLTAAEVLHYSSGANTL